MSRYKSNEFPTVHLVLSGSTKKITTLMDAAETLLLRWPPDEEGEKYVVAVKSCLDAVIGEVSKQDARLALIEAAKEAGLRVIAIAHISNEVLEGNEGTSTKLVQQSTRT